MQSNKNSGFLESFCFVTSRHYLLSTGIFIKEPQLYLFPRTKQEITYMETLCLIRNFLALAFFMLVLTTVTTLFSDFEASDEPDESRNICNIAKLHFQNGDWVQEAGGAPMMPFDDSDMPKNFSGIGSLLRLASFWASQETGHCITCHNIGTHGSTRALDILMTIQFEGFYVESEENGEHMLCLLGTSMFPFVGPFADFSEWSTSHSCKTNLQSPFIKDDQLMLILRYPRNFTLTTRAVLGEMKSLNEKSDPKYFDKVHIASQLDFDSKYLFISEQLESKACNPCPYQDDFIDGGIQRFQGSRICKVLRMFNSETFDIVLVCNGLKHCNNLGPFMVGREIDRTGGIVDNFRLMITNVHCVPGARTGLSEATISAEGTWNSSSGQLCMVGCVGLETSLDGCNIRICFYFPVTFSVAQRSILFGTISNIKETDSYVPLLFENELHPMELWNRYNDYSKSYLSYKYSKIGLASALVKTNANFNLGAIMKKMFLKYPAVEDCNNITSLSLLSSELGFQVHAISDPLSNNLRLVQNTVVVVDVLSLGPLLGRYWPDLEHSYQREGTEHHANFSSTDRKLPLNISAHLTLTEEHYGHISKLFLEGLYDPVGGKMYLIGCRRVPESQTFLSNNNTSLERKMDCLIEVKIEYSSITTRWLINPTAKVSIASQRGEEDPFYFNVGDIARPPLF
ncbi:unnamed protein product [Ilex paraguariensis]|uniref:DUF2921 domain-containing protein n=1 Tax=Ilex paraguariensis TaxID=185542 RepID=A0ABC8U2X7_9AQUA